ncbi:toll/interleukin-1 receptor domain-containing protein [Mucilaginibacter celer]|uniref:TIR domain-containing protein n=1 Tax=Mucilaginibacter celer TaxID=2305508 RepID=A0A494W5U5_9SPHI|nr:toll/interleukin-1 receptor domain-containing protein [Mucilaginibacter celer]AYL98885.1 TIR domain-containing protein [Mucilaginibacter celer]
MHNPPKCFISYAWDRPAHQGWIKQFASQLRNDGVETILDQWHAVPGTQLPEFMEQAVRDSDFVLIICTPKYKLKSDTRTGGVGYEGDIITGEIFVKRALDKFIPVLRDGAWLDASPSFLLGKYYIDLVDGSNYQANYENLLRTLFNTREIAPPIGTPPASVMIKHAHAQRQIDALRWIKLELCTLPVLSDTPANRNELIRLFRNCLIKVFKDSYQAFSIMLNVKLHDEAQPGGIVSYALLGHHRSFIYECEKEHRDYMAKLLNARFAPDWQAQKERLKLEAAEEEKAFDGWRIIHNVEFLSLPVAVNIEYDPVIKRIKIISDDEEIINPKNYDNEVKTTSEALRFFCAMLKRKYANLGDIGYQFEFLPLLKLMIDFYDKKPINLDNFRCQEQNPEEWDYINYDFQAQLKGYN